ncbi:MAG TPA: hypothetical protein VL752_21860, partial [Acidisoma sp.]|uniref:hypothetical protein n=1 Tax=Acidisoma sp. TaxID=1872115 RepID=UPI002C8D3A86
SYVRDMQAAIQLLDKPEDAPAAAADLAMLASQLFDFAIALDAPRQEELQHSMETARLVADLGSALDERTEGQPKSIALNIGKARALLDVTIRQLEIGGPVVH